MITSRKIHGGWVPGGSNGNATLVLQTIIIMSLGMFEKHERARKGASTQQYVTKLSSSVL